MSRLLKKVCSELTPLEVLLIHYFSQNSGRCVSRVELLVYVWREKARLSNRVVDVAISKLRKKLDRKKVRLITHYGEGYRWLVAPKELNPEAEI